MNEFKFVEERTFEGTVKDTYTLVAEDKEQAIEQFKEILQSPADMAVLPHDSQIDNDEIVYNSDPKVTIMYKDSELSLDKEEEITLNELD